MISTLSRPSPSGVALLVSFALGAIAFAQPKTAQPSRGSASQSSAAVQTARVRQPVAPSVSRLDPAPSVSLVRTVTPLPRVYAPTRPREGASVYPWKRNITTTIFWIGEAPSGNNPTPNNKSSWDPQWQANYGGYDDPNRENRTWDFRPVNFVPKLNPFYVALPFNDVTNKEIAAQKIPWYKKVYTGRGSVCKGRWIAIRYGNKTCFAQWEDCGPFVTDDHEYVFGNARPKNPHNNNAGLDVSPAVRDYLGLPSGAACDWRFCEEYEVPDGPWRRYGANNTFVKHQHKETLKLQSNYAELQKKREEWLKASKASRLSSR